MGGGGRGGAPSVPIPAQHPKYRGSVPYFQVVLLFIAIDPSDQGLPASGKMKQENTVENRLSPTPRLSPRLLVTSGSFHASHSPTPTSEPSIPGSTFWRVKLQSIFTIVFLDEI